MRIEHIALNVSNVREQAQWYVQHLGMKIARQANDVNQIHFLADESGKVLLEFYSNPNAPVPDYAATNPLVLHLAFYAEDIRAERERLIAAGATPEGDITQTQAGDELVFLRDPWGLCIQLVHRQQLIL
jgi:glyoxylase I family protein